MTRSVRNDALKIDRNCFDRGSDGLANNNIQQDLRELAKCGYENYR